jgi:hypothetical protein
VTDIYKFAFAPQKVSRHYYNSVLFQENVAVYSEYSTEPVNALCGKNAEFVMLKQAGNIVTAVLKS